MRTGNTRRHRHALTALILPAVALLAALAVGLMGMHLAPGAASPSTTAKAHTLPAASAAQAGPEQGLFTAGAAMTADHGICPAEEEQPDHCLMAQPAGTPAAAPARSARPIPWPLPMNTVRPSPAPAPATGPALLHALSVSRT